MTRSATKVRDPELLALVQARLAELDHVASGAASGSTR